MWLSKSQTFSKGPKFCQGRSHHEIFSKTMDATDSSSTVHAAGIMFNRRQQKNRGLGGGFREKETQEKNW